MSQKNVSSFMSIDILNITTAVKRKRNRTVGTKLKKCPDYTIIYLYYHHINCVAAVIVVVAWLYQILEEESGQMLPKEDPVASCVPHCYIQDANLSCCLPAGAYTIVPSTYMPDCSAGFTLSLARRIHRSALFLNCVTLLSWSCNQSKWYFKSY